jgi:hydroxyethylthiazole kinase-like uncharacterized protein yjeF
LPAVHADGARRRGCARLALAVAPHARRIVVFAGPGNNGGDGIEAATILSGWGKPTSVRRVGVGAAPPADAGGRLHRATAAGVDVRTFDAGEATAGACPDLVIDALLGIGASRAPAGEIAAAIERIAALAVRGARVLAVDVPSGLDVDRGQALGATCVVADDTLTLIAAKPGSSPAAGAITPGGSGAPVSASPSATTTRRPGSSAAATSPASPRRAATPPTREASATSPSSAARPEWPARRGSPRARRTAPGLAASSSTSSTMRQATRLERAKSIRCIPELMVRPGWDGGDAAAIARRPWSAAAAAATRFDRGCRGCSRSHRDSSSTPTL